MYIKRTKLEKVRSGLPLNPTLVQKTAFLTAFHLHKPKTKHSSHKLSNLIYDYNHDVQMTLYFLLHCLTLANVRRYNVSFMRNINVKLLVHTETVFTKKNVFTNNSLNTNCNTQRGDLKNLQILAFDPKHTYIFCYLVLLVSLYFIGMYLHKIKNIPQNFQISFQILYTENCSAIKNHPTNKNQAASLKLQTVMI